MGDELAAGRIEKIVGCENNGILLVRDRQNVVLKNKSGRQNRKRLAINCLGVQRDDWDAEEISNGREKTLLVHLAGIENLGRPGTAVEILRELGGFFARFHPARDQKIDNRFAYRRAHLQLSL